MALRIWLVLALSALLSASACAENQQNTSDKPIDISLMPDRLPSVSAGETIALDISPLLQANPNLHRVRWELTPRIATRKGRVRTIPGDPRNEGGTFLYWQFDAPSMSTDMDFTLTLTAYEKSKESVSKEINIAVKAGNGDVYPQVEHHRNVKIGDKLTFDASSSYSTNGPIKQIIWRQTEGPYLNADKTSGSELSFVVPSFDNANIGVYANDLKPGLPNPYPDNFTFPAGLQNQVDIQYLGAFAVDIDPDKEDKTSINFGKGVIAVDEQNENIWVTGNKSSIAQFKIPKQLSLSNNYVNLPRAEPVQDYFIIEDQIQVGSLRRHNINGMLIDNGQLFITVEDTYDSNGSKETMQWCSDAYNLKDADCRGFYNLQGKNTAAGWMSELPDEWAHEFGYSHSAGWASNNSIDHRYSIGPSFYMFNPDVVEDIDLDIDLSVPSKKVISYPMPNTINERPSPREALPNDPKWGSLMSVNFGLVVPNSDLFIAFGRGAGLEGGTGYKISNKDGQPSNGGDRTYLPEDTYPYFWVYDLRDAIDAENSYDPQPISFGKFPLPLGRGERSTIVGGAWNKHSSTLYLALSDTSTRKGVSRAPSILAFSLKAKTSSSQQVEIPKRISFDVDVTDAMGYTKRTQVSATLEGESLPPVEPPPEPPIEPPVEPKPPVEPQPPVEPSPPVEPQPPVNPPIKPIDPPIRLPIWPPPYEPEKPVWPLVTTEENAL